MNAIIIAHKKANTLADESLKGSKSVEDIKKELMKRDKKVLVDMLASHIKTQKVTIESVARRILEDEECEWLTYAEIASVISAKMGSNTTHKGIADYASKRPDWNVRPRKSQSDRNKIIASLIHE